MVESNETPARVLEIDRVWYRAEETIEQIALVEERIFCRLQAADVDQREHDAVGDPLGAIRQDAHEERLAVQVGEIAFDRLPGRQDTLEIVDQIRVVHRVRERLDRPPDVVRHQAEGPGHLRRELADPELSVEEDRADLGAGQQRHDQPRAARAR